MTEPNLQLLGSPDFIPDKYVREISQNCIGRSELVRLKSIIQTLSEETSSNLKKNVYQNYMQFIDTAKEISHLESEMYQLSHLLAEQKTLLGALYNTSILGDDSPKIIEADTTKKQSAEEKEDEMRQKIAAVFEKVEGCTDLLDVRNRTLLHEGYLTELDAVENTPIKTVCGFLFNDGVMLTTSNSNVRGPMRYKFEAYYELGSLAVVNVRDLGNIKYAFKLLAFPDTRVFQCKSNMSKKEWLDKFDLAKKARLTHDQIKRESVSEKSPSRSASIDSPSLNPFEETEEDVFEHPDWLLEAPEELDVYVAQRHFDEALALLQKAKDYIAQYKPPNNQPDHVLSDIQRKVEQRHTTLTEVLMKELEVNPDKSLQGGLRAARKAVRLLNQLGRSRQSCELFLKLCSSMLKTQYKRVKREGSTNMYVRYLSSVVFTNLCHMTEEFLRAYPKSSSCTSAFIVWASTELSLFTIHFIKQVFVPQTNLSTLADCVVLIRFQCDRLCTYGIDLCYQLDGALRTPITKALREARDKQTDVIKRKSAEAVWIPSNLRTKMGLARCLQEQADMGLNLDGHVTGDCWLQLSANTLGFIKQYLNLLNDCMKLKTPELLYTIDEILYDVFEAQINYIEQSVKSETQNDNRQFIVKNANFLLTTFMSLVQKKYEDVNGFKCKTLEKLVKEHAALMRGVTPSSRKITNYVSNEYL